MKEILDTDIDFDKLFEAKSSKDVGEMLDKHLLGEEGSTDTQPAASDKASSVDEAFQDLLAS